MGAHTTGHLSTSSRTPVNVLRVSTSWPNEKTLPQQPPAALSPWPTPCYVFIPACNAWGPAVIVELLGYHLFIAWKSIRRTPLHSLLMVAGFAVGVAVATLFSAIRHTYTRDPIPQKSSVLHYVRMDSWGPREPFPKDGIPSVITYPDALGIMKSDIPLRQSASYEALLRISDPTGRARPQQDTARICTADFFTMFDLPFRYGSAWDRSADQSALPVVVLSDPLNQQMFGGEDSVGRLVRIEGREFRIVGVLGPFQPATRYYAPANLKARPEQMFLPLSHTKPMRLFTSGPRANWQPAGSYEATLSNSCFIEMWVELSGAREVAAYKSFLDSYVMEQKKIGRFPRPLDNRVTPLLEYIRERGYPPPQATALAIASNLFLCACALSLMGLLLSRFLSRAAEIGVRRALGARRWDIFLQHITESEVVALAGGVLGLVLTFPALWLVNAWYKTADWDFRDDLFRMDLAMGGFALAVSLGAGLLAGIYPAYRVCRVPPASHLKIQ